MGDQSSLRIARDDMVGRFIGIPGLGRSRAEAIYDAGYTNLGLLRKASVEELTKVPGVGISLARCIKNNISHVKEEVPAEVTVTAPAGSAPTHSKDDVGKVEVGGSAVQPSSGPAASGQGAPAGAPEAPVSAPSAQPKRFLSSLFGKILGKPEEKKPEPKPPEKKEEPKAEGKPGDHEVKVEGRPDEKPKEEAAIASGKDEPPKIGPEPETKTVARPDAPVDDTKAEGKHSDEGVKVEGKA
jgi:NAD-dependent DNA ligase